MSYKKTLMWKEISETEKVFNEICAPNNETLDKLLKEVKDAKIKHIVTCGRGTSNHALIYFKYLVEVLAGIPVIQAYPSVVTIYNGKIDYSDTLIVGVSQSGKAQDVLEILKHGKSSGAVTLGITNNKDSAIAKTASYHLFCNAGEEKSVAATKTFSAQLYLLCALALKLANDKKISKQLGSLSAKLKNDFSEIDKITEKLIPKYKNMTEGFALSRGITYSIALEASLKLQETAYVKMKGFAISDFYHGPMAMVSEGSNIIVYASKIGFVSEDLEAEHFTDVKKCVEKMLALKANVLVVTDDERYAELCSNSVMLPKLDNEILTMFYFALFAQMFACKLSVAKGNNPDAPRSLSKVTITK